MIELKDIVEIEDTGDGFMLSVGEARAHMFLWRQWT